LDLAMPMDDNDPQQGVNEAEEQIEPVDVGPGETIALIESVRVIEPIRSGPPAIVQAAAVAATGFVAGAATAAVLGRRRARQAIGAPHRQRSLPAPPLVNSQTFLVHVQTLRRP
jgi:hypothetical protein